MAHGPLVEETIILRSAFNIPECRNKKKCFLTFVTKSFKMTVTQFYPSWSETSSVERDPDNRFDVIF